MKKTCMYAAGCSSAIEQNEITPSAATWMDLEIVTLRKSEKDKYCLWVQFSSLSHVWLFVIPWTAAHQASLSITNSFSLLRRMSLSQWCHSNEYSGLISFRIDLFGLPVVQGTLNSLLQFHSSKASILWCSPFFMVQLSHSYVTTGKTIALTRQTFVGKVRSLLFNMLSRLVIAFPPRSQMSFNFMAAVTICSDFGLQENKICHCFHITNKTGNLIIQHTIRIEIEWKSIHLHALFSSLSTLCLRSQSRNKRVQLSVWKSVNRHTKRSSKHTREHMKISHC